MNAVKAFLHWIKSLLYVSPESKESQSHLLGKTTCLTPIGWGNPMGIKVPLRNSHQRQVHLCLIPTVRLRFSIVFHAFPGLGGTRRVISGTGVRPTVQWAVPGSGVPSLGDPSPRAFPDGDRDLSKSQTCWGGSCDYCVTVLLQAD